MAASEPKRRLRLQALSDLHLERPIDFSFELVASGEGADRCLCLLGDIGNPLSLNKSYGSFLLEQAHRKDADGRPAFRSIFLLAGNHVTIAHRCLQQYYANASFNQTQDLIQLTVNAVNDSVVAGGGESVEEVRGRLGRLSADVAAGSLRVGPSPLYAERDEHAGPVRFMWRQRVDVDETWTVLGVTLWSDVLAAAGGDNKAALSMNDFRKIKFESPAAELSADKYTQLHRDDVAWLEAQLAELRGGERKVVIMSHHPPTLRNAYNPDHPHIPDESMLGLATALDGNAQLFAKPVVLWMHGHTHWSTDYAVPAADGSDHAVRVFSNQLGYPREAGTTGFDAARFVDLCSPSLDLWLACAAGDLAAVERLLAAAAAAPLLIDYRWIANKTPLIAVCSSPVKAARRHCLAIAERLLERGATVNAVDAQRRCALTWTVFYQNTCHASKQATAEKLAKLLRSHGAEPEPDWMSRMPQKEPRRCLVQ